MRLRWLAVSLILAGVALARAAAAGPRALATTLGVEAAIAAGAVAWGARRFTAPPVRVRDGSGAGYHIDAPRLFRLGAGHIGPGRRLAGGVPVVDYGALGEQFNPAYAAWWALAHLNRYMDAGLEADRATALAAVHALVARAERRAGGVVWTYAFDWPVFGDTLRAPWISAMAQGLAISALVRAFRLTGECSLLHLARAAATPFEQPVAAGGVRTILNGRIYYEEYPTPGGSLVLDGSLFALLGLYDLWTATGDATVRRLFGEGVEGIAANLAVWDVRGLWSRYGHGGGLSTPAYHALNTALLDALGRLTRRDPLCALAARWRRSPGGPARRSTLYLISTAVLYYLGLRSMLPWRGMSRRGHDGEAGACAD